MLAIQVYVEREYIWGPGDKGVDELLVQFDHTVDRKPWWVIQDDGGDVVAVCDTIATGAHAGKGRVVQQLTYDAYGEALSSTTLVAHPVLHCGHKALFVDRLDVGVSSTNGIEWERVVPFAHILCQNRNRVYSPQAGRFLQADPNESGMALLSAAGYNGRGIDALSIAFGLEGHYGDGMNAYEYLGSNPWGRNDPMGLSWDPFSMVDELLSARSASATALLNELGSTARAWAEVTATVMSYLPFPGCALIGDMVLAALEGRPLGDILLQAAIGFIPGGQLAMLIGSIATDLADITMHSHGQDEVDDETQEAIREFIGESAPTEPGMAKSKTGALVKACVANGLPLLNIFAQGLDGGEGVDVYVGKDKDGKIVYVGISNDPIRRGKEHGERFPGGIDVITEKTGPVTRLQARAIETAAMTRHGSTGGTNIHAQFSAQNRNRSFGPKRAHLFQAALSYGSQWLATNASHLH